MEVIAGPCSINQENIQDVYRIADIMVSDGRGEMIRAVSGTRVVGLKSRTELNPTGVGMGIDFPHLFEEGIVLPSVLIAQEIVQKTNLLVATEIMMPEVQIPHFVGRIPPGKLLLWNPSVNQLGWQVMQMAQFARQNGWDIGFKNGKWLGEPLTQANNPGFLGETSLERAWSGLATFAKNIDGRIIMIHRGVDIPEKGNYRNFPVHEIARRAKRKTGALLFFDPSHVCGPRMRDAIVKETINAMRMEDGNDFLYDGILIEAGTSTTDTGQHITLLELESLVKELSHFRNLRQPMI